MYLKWDPDLRSGELVTIDPIGGAYTLLPLDSCTLEITSDVYTFDPYGGCYMFFTSPQVGIFLRISRIDYKIDVEESPLVLIDGRKMLVERGSVRRVDQELE